MARTSTGLAASVESDFPLEPARSAGADEALLREQLGRLGGTIYRLRSLDATIAGDPMIPKSVLNQLRRDLVARLDAQAPRPRPGPSPPGLCCRPCSPRFSRSEHVECGNTPASSGPSELSVLCRRTDQIEAAVAAGIATIYADYQDIKEYADAVTAARRGGAAIYLATPRIEKPQEANLFRYLAKQGADGILVRNAGGLYFCAERRHPVRRRLLAQRGQPADRRAASRPAAPHA